MKLNIENIVMIVIKYFEKKKILSLNNPLGVCAIKEINPVKLFCDCSKEWSRESTWIQQNYFLNKMKKLSTASASIYTISPMNKWPCARLSFVNTVLPIIFF